MNDKQIECFMKVSACRSFSKAAKELYITQPAVTHQIAVLEAELGFRLFYRDNKNVSLTTAGQHYAKTMQPLMAQTKKCISEARKIAQSEELSLSIGHTAPEGDPCFNLALNAFQKAHPDYVMDVRAPYTGEMTSDLRLRRMDAVLTAEKILQLNNEWKVLPLWNSIHASACVPMQDGQRDSSVMVWRKDNAKEALKDFIDFMTAYYSSYFSTEAASSL